MDELLPILSGNRIGWLASTNTEMTKRTENMGRPLQAESYNNQINLVYSLLSHKNPDDDASICKCGCY